MLYVFKQKRTKNEYQQHQELSCLSIIAAKTNAREESCAISRAFIIHLQSNWLTWSDNRTINATIIGDIESALLQQSLWEHQHENKILVQINATTTT